MNRRFEYIHSFIDSAGGYDGWGAALAADFDGDGRPEYVTGGKGGGFYHLYDYMPNSASWRKIVITNSFSPNVGAAAVDVDGDGRPELVCGEWGDRLFWVVAAPGREDFGSCHAVYKGLDDPHDVLAGDIDGDGADEVIVREKNGRLMYFRIPPDPAGPWHPVIIDSGLEGDGTAVACLSGRKGLDIVTNRGWYENVNGDGTRWKKHPLVPEHIDWHPESRLVPADIDGDGKVEIVISESEISNARLAVLKQQAPGSPWKEEILIEANEDFRALHSLQVVDLDNDGKPEIFTAEMENGKTDGVVKKPRWLCLSRSDGGEWERHVILDINLGTHTAVAADYDGDGIPEIVGKVWRANRINGNNGRNHVDWVKPLFIK